MDSQVVTTRSAAATERAAEQLAASLRGGEVLALYGGLGAGKTVFAKGLARALGISQRVVSPTFAVMREYYGRLRLCHYDMYRVDVASAECLGLAEAFNQPDTVCLIEWAENVEALLPPNTTRITLDVLTHSSRKITIARTTLPLTNQKDNIY